MDLYGILAERDLINPALLQLLFGDGKKRSAPLKNVASLPHLMFDVCMFYTAILETRYIAKAIAENKTIYEYIENKSISGSLKDLWVNEKCDLSEGLRIISFLGECSNHIRNPEVFGENLTSCLKEVSAVYTGYLENRMDHEVFKTQAIFVRLIENLPLLRNISINTKSATIYDGSSKLRYEPFFFIDTDEDGHSSVKITVNCTKGEQNHVLELQTYEFGALTTENIKVSRNYRVSNSEYSLVICSTLELNTNWYNEEEYLGNCAFVVKVARVLCETALRDIRQHDSFKGVLKDLKNYFNFNKAPELEDIDEFEMKIKHVDEEGSVIYRDGKTNTYGLQNFILGLVIKYGAFQTLHDFFYDEDLLNVKNKEYKIDFKELFNTALGTIRDLEMTAENQESIEACVEKYRRDIDRHIRELNTIMPRNERAFNNRRDHIYAEHRASCILNILGLKNQDMYMAQETMLSIHDYCDLITYRYLDLRQVVKNITAFLIKFYSRVTGKSVDVPEDLAPHQYIRIFREYCESIETCSDLINKIGRPICKSKDLIWYENMFSKIKEWISDGIDRNTKEYFFVSYSHADYERVKKIVEELRGEKYNLIIDRETFEAGDNWTQKARDGIDNCTKVLSFLSKNSIRSEAVEKELQYAEAEAKMRYKNGTFTDDQKNRFIIPINISGTPKLDWIDEMVHDKDLESDVRNNVSSIRSIIHPNRVYYEDDNNLMEKLRTTISETLMNSDTTINFDSLNPAETALLSYLYYLKTGEPIFFDESNRDILVSFDEGKEVNIDRCIYPLLISVNEMNIKRDKVTILSYEVINGKKNDHIGDRLMLTSDPVPASDYYCIPNIRSCGECGEWISNPLLVPVKDLR